MIRAFVLLLLMALPVQAQNFDGFRPGDPASDLSRLGPSMSLLETDDGLMQAAYALPRRHVLQVRYERDTGAIQRLITWGPIPDGIDDTGRLRVHQTTLNDVIDRFGDEFPDIVTPSFVEFAIPSRTLRLYFDVSTHPEAILVLVFFWPGEADDIADIAAQAPEEFDALPGHSVLGQVELLDRTYMAQLPDVYPADILNRAETIPFPLSVEVAFPPLLP